MNESIVKLLGERYFLSNENEWESIAKRVSFVNENIFNYINDLIFIPSSPTLMNANTKGERSGTLSSCFTMNIEDSIEGIYEALKESAIVTKNGGGVGYDFSDLRGSEELVKGINRPSSGPLPFINVFNATLDGIMQGGVRRGAGMGMLDINHPNILDFIEAKSKVGQFTRLNFSIRVSDQFYKTLEESPDSPWMVFNKASDSGYALKDKDGNIVTAKQLWDLIIDRAWATAEPGIFNSDIAFRQCSVTNVDKHVLSNPCFTGDTLIAVAGARNEISIKELSDKNESFLVYSGRKKKRLNYKNEDNWKIEIKKAVAFKTGTKEVFKVSLNNGDSFKCTKDHLLALYRGDYIETKNSLGNRLSSFFTFKEKNHVIINSFSNAHAKQHRMIYEYYNGEIPKGNVIHHINYDNDFINNLKMLSKEDHDMMMKKERLGKNNPIHKMDKKYHSFLAKKQGKGFSNANSSGISNTEIVSLAKKLYSMGKPITINNLIALDNRVPNQFSNYRFDRKLSNLIDIVVNNKEYKEPIFDQVMENPNIEIIDNSFYLNEVFVSNIEYIGVEDVYDLTVEDNNNFYIYTGKNARGDYRGVLVHNCSEYVSIPYGSCNLGSINLERLIVGKKFDWEKFENVIVEATRYLNAIIDVNKYPIKKIKETTLKIRPIGLGYMGLAHAMFKKEIPYNSDKGFKFIEDVTRYLTLRSMKESCEIAKKDGAYEAFDYETYMKANERFFNKDNCRNIDIEQLKKDIKKYGVRNSVTTSIAPTGSIAFIADTSSGIEPVFALTYARKIEKENKEYDIVYISDPVFDDYMVKNFSTEQKQEILKNVSENNGSCQNCKIIPDEMKKVFVVAGDITPMEHLEALSKAAVNCSTSVSKTINLPSDISKEEVAKVYIEAHKKGIIGVTVYRDGCREGILLYKVDDRPKKLTYHHAPKRPESVECDVHRVTYKGEKWIAFVGLAEVEGSPDKVPFEIFCGKINDVNLPAKITNGIITKISSGHYAFENDGEILIKDILKIFNNEDNDDFARSISLSLRSGVMLQHICDTLSKSKGDITKFSKVLMRILKMYLKDGMTASGKCDRCGAKLVYKDGCISCSSPLCSWSKCG